MRPRNRWRRIANLSSLRRNQAAEIVDVMLVLKMGGLGKWAKSSALLSCGVAFGMVL